MQNHHEQPHKVAVRQLRLSHYRNYTHIKLDFPNSHVVFTGHNGAGKTNLLESLSFLSQGRGLRRAPYNEIIRANPLENSDATEPFVIFAKLQSEKYGEVNIGTTIDPQESGRKLRIDGVSQPIDRLNDYCRVIWLTPAMDGLFTGTSSERRRFLDRMVLAIDPAHAKRVIDFEKLMRSRNRLLLDGNEDKNWFDALECQMAELAIAIAAARLDLIGYFENLANDLSLDRDLKGGKAFPQAKLQLDGAIENALLKFSALDVEEDYMQKLRDKRALDRAAGRTLEGPHRCDLKVFYKEKNMAAAICSTGEQKALLTGLILSHAKLTTEITHIVPILLLDEIVAHLDEQRRGTLFDILDHYRVQSFMTGTDQSLFNHLQGKAAFFEVANGVVL